MQRLLALLLCLVAVQAGAQTSPNWTQGYVPPPVEWNNLWSSKADVTNGTLTNPAITGGTISGTPISGSAGAFTTLSSSGNAAVGGNLVVTGTITGAGSFLPLGGGTLTGALTGTAATFSGAVAAGSLQSTGLGLITAGSVGGNNGLRLTPVAPGTDPAINAAGPAGAIGIRFVPQSGGLLSLNGSTVINMTKVLALTDTANVSATMAANFIATHSGVSGNTGILNLNQWIINDSVDHRISDTVSGSAVFGLTLIHTQTAAAVGDRIAFGATLLQGAAPTAVSGNPGDQATQFSNFIDYDYPGASSSNLLGFHYGFSANVRLRNPVNVVSLLGFEQDIGSVTGSTIGTRAGIIVAGSGVNSTQGKQADTALFFPYDDTLAGGWRDVIGFGGNNGNPADPNVGAYLRYNAGGNYVVGQKPGKAQWFSDMSMASFPSTGTPGDGGFIRGPGLSGGFSVDGNGRAQIGSSFITPSSTGLAIDAAGSYGTAATIASGGSGYVNGYHAFRSAQYGGLWLVTVDLTGVGTSTNLAQITAPVFPSTSAPPATIALTEVFRSGTVGSGMTLNITWNTTAVAVMIQPTAGGKIGFFGATPVVKDAGWTAMTGTPDKATAYATSTVTLAQLAGRVMQMQATMTAYGLVGP